jgi:phosphoglycerol transferase MdoB-like AlkP superfamily enzyme
MFKSLIFFVRFFLLWLLFFAIDRFVFMFIFHKKLRDIPLSDKFYTYYQALRLDLSLAAYLAVVPILIYIFWYFTKKETISFNWVVNYNRVLIVLFGFFSIINFNTYREWGSKINYSAVAPIIFTPKEAIASSGTSPFMFSMFIWTILIVSGFYLNFILTKKKIQFSETPLHLKLVVAILLMGFNFLLIRGGWGTAPNSQSMAYFSKYEILNHASLNTEWNLMSSILAANKINKNPYTYMDQQTADQAINELYKVEKDTTISVLKTARPNIVVFLLESFTADLTKTLGNEDGISPTFDSLINKGVFFTKIYSAGTRTDKGIIGTLTGFPTLGSGSIAKWPEKMKKIPAISQKLFQNNYETSFYYGGEAEFGNYKAFILSHDYQNLIDKNSFEKKDMNSKWGAFDGLVFNKQLADMNATKKPFFSTILSLTNHEPFEVPGTAKFGRKTSVEAFKSTAYYTDSCISSYLEQAKKQDWYKNTLFIFIADHGHLFPKNKSEIFQPERYHIPLLFYGDVIKDEFKGKKFDQVGSQQDLSATLLAQLNIPHQDFLWSRNLLNPYTKNFAFFTWDNGLGFINNNHYVTFDTIGNNILYNSNPSDQKQTNLNLNQGKSYLQSVYQQFIKL